MKKLNLFQKNVVQKNELQRTIGGVHEWVTGGAGPDDSRYLDYVDGQTGDIRYLDVTPKPTPVER